MRFWIFFLISSWVSAHQCQNYFGTVHTPLSAISYLQNMQYEKSYPVLAFQNEYTSWIDPRGKGACATVTMVNFIQVLRRMIGQETLLNSDTLVREAFQTMPSLLKGKVSNDEMLRLLTYFQKYISPRTFDLQVITTPLRASEADGKQKQVRTAITAEDLEIKPNQLKLVIYQMRRPSGRIVSRHFVVLKNREGNQVTLLDPTMPNMDYVYNLMSVPLKGSDGQTLRFVEDGNTVQETPLFFEIDTVLTLMLHP